MSAIAGAHIQAMTGLCTNAVITDNEAPGEWLIDSGALHHMTRTLSDLTCATKSAPLRIRMANGEARKATHTGSTSEHGSI